MDRDVIDGKWTEIKGQLREAYGDLTDDEGMSRPVLKL